MACVYICMPLKQCYNLPHNKSCKWQSIHNTTGFRTIPHKKLTNKYKQQQQQQHNTTRRTKQADMQPEITNVWRHHWCRTDTGVERRLSWRVIVAEFSRYFVTKRQVPVRQQQGISVVINRIHITALYRPNTTSRYLQTRHSAFELTECLTRAGREITCCRNCNYTNCSGYLRGPRSPGLSRLVERNM